MGEWRGQLEQHLRGSLVFESLSPGEVQRIAAKADRVDLDAGDLLWAWGDEPGGGLAVILEGRLTVQRTHEDDTTVAFRVMKPGAMIGFSTLAGEPHTADIAAGSDAVVAILPHRPLAALIAARPKVAFAIIGYLGHLVGLLSDEKETWRAGSVLDRVRLWLRSNAVDDEVLRITHAVLARHVGATRANVSRALERLAAVGAIRLGRGWIQVLDLSIPA